MRGQQLPVAAVIVSSGTRSLQVNGTNRAGWFVHDLPSPIAAAVGQLHWDWRVSLSARGTDISGLHLADAGNGTIVEDIQLVRATRKMDDLVDDDDR